MIDIKDIRTHAEVTVRVNLVGAPEVKADYRDNKYFVPDYVSVEYVPDPENGRWIARHVGSAGHLILKPGPNGEQRLGKDKGKRSWGGFQRDVQDTEDLPEWLDRLITELRPTGEIALPGGG